MYAHKAVPCWQVFDQGYVGRYVLGRQPVAKRRVPEALIEKGVIKRADTLADWRARSVSPPTD